MAGIINIMNRARALRQETALNSITPERAGGIMYDTLDYINQEQLQAASPLVISKIYDSVASMEADDEPVSDLTGKALKPGQVVVIVTGDPDDPDDSVIYRYNGTEEGVSSWTAVGKLGGVAPYLEGYLYVGVATPVTDPQTANITQKVYYRATEAGTYTDFDGLVVNAGEVCNLKWNGSAWSKEVTGAATKAELTELDQKVDELGGTIDFSNADASYNTTAGYYISGNAITASANYSYSSPIHLNAGETIEGKWVNSGANAISLTDQNGTSYSKLISGTSQSPLIYKYKAVDDCYVAICWRSGTASPEYVKIIASSRIERMDKVLGILDDKVLNDGNPLNTIEGTLIGTGEIQASTTNVVFSDYIPVTGGHTIWVSYQIADADNCMVYYDSNKEVLGFYALYGAFGRSASLPAGAAFVRFSTVASTAKSAYIYDLTVQQLIWSASKTIEQIVDSNSKSIDAITSGIANINDFILPFKKEEILPYSTETNYELAGDGFKGSCTGVSVLKKYAVVAGDILYLNLSKDTTRAVFQFQNALSVPSSGTSNLVGEVYKFAINGFVKVPTGATYLIVSQFVANTTNKVYKVIQPNAQQIVDGAIGGERSKTLFKSVDWRIRNGSQGNSANAYVVTIYGSGTLAIPVTPGHRYRLIVNRTPTTGYNLYYSFYTYSTNNPANLHNSDVVRNDTLSGPAAHPIYEDVEIMPGEAGISFQLTEAVGPGVPQSPTNNIVLRQTDFSIFDIVVLDVTAGLFYGPESSPVFERNTDRLPALYNACRWHKSSATAKDFAALICTDVHAWWLAQNNALEATNEMEMIDCYINCGDTCASYYNPAQIGEFQSALLGLMKPGYIVCGNHDVGKCYFVGYACNHAQAYAAFIKPMVDAGWLVSGEYEADKPYWYHDDATRKIRLIGLYEYDDNLDINETYWKKITYNSALSNIAFSTAYAQGAQVNVNGYTAYSFEAVQAVTTPANYYTDAEKLPSYKVKRGSRVIRQTQAQWYLDTLASTPANYGVIVIMHNPFSDLAITQDLPFSWPSGVQGSSFSQNNMQTDLIRDALVAFKNGAAYSANVVMKGDASYLNTEGGGTYAYSVSKDFSAKNAGVVLLGVLGGHSHRDLVWKDASEAIYQITPICAIVDSENDRNGDVRRTTTDGLCADSLTVASFASGRIGLVKIGVNVTDRGTRRDYEVIDTTS